MKKPKYLKIPYQLVETKGIRPADLKVWGVIYHLSWQGNKKCIASNKTIADQSCVSERTVEGCLTRLEKEGAIRRTYVVKDGDTKRTEIIPLWTIIEEVVPVKDKKKSDTSNGGGIRQTAEAPSIGGQGGTSGDGHNITAHIDINTITEPSPAPEEIFDFNQEIKKLILDRSKNPHSWVIASLFSLKGLKFENHKQFYDNYKRHLAPARDLVKAGYQLDDIRGCMKHCEVRFDGNWVLTTVAKYMPEFLKVKGNK